jgi:hypothetical protein
MFEDVDEMKLRKLAEMVWSILSEFENKSTEDEPERPSTSSLPEIDFYRSSVSMGFQGRRPRGPEGAIVHYSASYVHPESHTPKDAEGVIGFGAEQGYCYASISRDGRIVLPANWDWMSWGYHAGKSQLPDGRHEVSMRCVGFELCNPGMLIEHGDKLYPWYNDPRKDSFKPSGQSWWKEDGRYIEGEANIAKGWYLPFTGAQERTLIDVLVWMAYRFEHFNLEWVLGHDEVSPGRKTDPGGALSMTMPDFRFKLKSLLLPRVKD